MASSIIAQTSGGTGETSATNPHPHASAANLHNTHLNHLSSLSHHYTNSHSHAQAHAYSHQTYQQPHHQQQHHQQQLQQQQQHHHHHQHQQQQQQNWDYYARQQQAQANNSQPQSNNSNSNNNSNNLHQHQQQQHQQSSHASSSNGNGNGNANNSNSNPNSANGNGSSANDSVSSQSNGNNNYTRPWEMETKDTPKGGFEPFSKLPSFQSQFHGYNDQLMADGTPMPGALPHTMSSLQTVAMSPASLSVSSPGMVSVGSPLAQLASGLQTSITPPSASFAPLAAPPPPPPNAFHHPLGGVNAHPHHRTPYPLVPAPLQARDIATTLPSTTGGYGTSTPLDDSRHHLQLYQPLTPAYAPPPPLPPTTAGNLQLSLGIVKKEPGLSAFDLNNSSGSVSNNPVTPMGMHTPTPSYDGSTSSMMDTSNGAGGPGGYHTPHSTHTGSTGPHTPHTTQPHTPTPSTTTTIKVEKVLNSPIARVDARKKERRKNRANSLESSAESEASAMDVDPSNPGQVDAVSSTANFKSPLSTLGMGDSNDTNGEKQSKKKRKRCGECIGCQRKDNCGECAPCRNDKSHQICKQRRCEKLTEKKEPKAKQIVYGADGQRAEPRRGRGKARSSAAGNGNGTPNIGVNLEEPLLKLDGEASILGLRWNTASDELTFKIQTLPTPPISGWTKRLILSVTARLYDPVGLAAPFVVRAKILLQNMWKTGVGWDETLPRALDDTWHSIFSEVRQFENLHIPRWLGHSQNGNVSLHGFSDASVQAYGAAVYILVHDKGRFRCNLVLAKSRVAPLKEESIPRLELRAAALLGELMQRIQTICETEHHMTISSISCWSDSRIVLCWIKHEIGALKQFVANRVRRIQESTQNCKWRYVPTDKNPADLISRGMTMRDLITSTKWWHGPAFLQCPEEEWPKTTDDFSTVVKEEVSKECRLRAVTQENPLSLQKKGTAGVLSSRPQKSCQTQLVASINSICLQHQSLLYRYSSIHRLIRVTAWIFRFIQHCRTPPAERSKGCISVQELEEALTQWIKQEQLDHYKNDIQALRRRDQAQPLADLTRLSDPIRSLAPFLQDGVMRMRGRLQNAELPFYQCNPAILPGKGRLAWLLARESHIKLLHCGAQQLVAVLRERYWIIGVRSLARTLIKDCLVCTRLRARTTEQIMGDLPACRVRPARPFLHTGVDYAGPIYVRPDRRKGKILIKGYIAVFVCMVSKAVHLEFVSDLTTNAFIMAFIRCTSRYGHCLHIWSDNGTNFVGAERELGRMLQGWQGSDLFDKLSARQTQWHFITPAAPHQGGLWEAAVKSAKHHLRRVMGARLLTVEAMQTLLAEISAILNSRPLCAQSADPQDLHPLTPAHLLIGESMVPVLGEQVPLDKPENRLNYWQVRQQISQRFWKLWSSSYLHELQQRSKWRTARANLKVGDLIVIKNEATPPTLWKMARVTELHPGADGLVRNVTVWTGQGYLSRPVQKLCLLPLETIEPR